MRSWTRLKETVSVWSRGRDIPHNPALEFPMVDQPGHLTSRLDESILGAASTIGASARIINRNLRMNALALPTEEPNRTLWGKCRQIVRNFRDHPLEFLGLLSLALFFATIFVAEGIAGVFSSAIVSDSTALSISPACGLWGPKESIGTRTIRALDQARVKAEAYANDCYAPNGTTDGCNDFYHQKINYTVRREEACTLKRNICLQQNASTYILDTGLVDSRYLGINSIQNFYFRRQSNCSRLWVHTKVQSLEYPFDPLKDIDEHYDPMGDLYPVWVDYYVGGGDLPINSASGSGILEWYRHYSTM
jgi:hypothetical protein